MSGGASWWSLVETAQLASELRREWTDRPPVACPNDGEPLEQGKGGVLHCRFDGWTWDGMPLGGR